MVRRPIVALGSAPVLAAVALTLLCGLVPGGTAEAAPPELRLVYRPPALSLETHEASLPEVLRQIGATVGFTVVDAGRSRRSVTVFIQDAPLHEVLRQLLRDENHALVYRASGQGIETIVLLGSADTRDREPAPGDGRPGTADARTVTERAVAEARARFPGLTGAGHASALVPGRVEPEAPVHALEGGERHPAPDDGIREVPPDIQVAQLLETYALAGLHRLAGVDSPAPPAAQTDPGVAAFPPMAPPVLPPRADQALQDQIVLATRLARENLKALVDALGVATTSLLHSRGGGN